MEKELANAMVRIPKLSVSQHDYDLVVRFATIFRNFEILEFQNGKKLSLSRLALASNFGIIDDQDYFDLLSSKKSLFRLLIQVRDE